MRILSMPSEYMCSWYVTIRMYDTCILQRWKILTFWWSVKHIVIESHSPGNIPTGFIHSLSPLSFVHILILDHPRIQNTSEKGLLLQSTSGSFVVPVQPVVGGLSFFRSKAIVRDFDSVWWRHRPQWCWLREAFLGTIGYCQPDDQMIVFFLEIITNSNPGFAVVVWWFSRLLTLQSIANGHGHCPGGCFKLVGCYSNGSPPRTGGRRVCCR